MSFFLRRALCPEPPRKHQRVESPEPVATGFKVDQGLESIIKEATHEDVVAGAGSGVARADTKEEEEEEGDDDDNDEEEEEHGEGGSKPECKETLKKFEWGVTTIRTCNGFNMQVPTHYNTLKTHRRKLRTNQGIFILPPLKYVDMGLRSHTFQGPGEGATRVVEKHECGFHAECPCFVPTGEVEVAFCDAAPRLAFEETSVRKAACRETQLHICRVLGSVKILPAGALFFHEGHPLSHFHFLVKCVASVGTALALERTKDLFWKSEVKRVGPSKPEKLWKLGIPLRPLYWDTALNLVTTWAFARELHLVLRYIQDRLSPGNDYSQAKLPDLLWVKNLEMNCGRELATMRLVRHTDTPESKNEHETAKEFVVALGFLLQVLGPFVAWHSNPKHAACFVKEVAQTITTLYGGSLVSQDHVITDGLVYGLVVCTATILHIDAVGNGKKPAAGSGGFVFKSSEDRTGFTLATTRAMFDVLRLRVLAKKQGCELGVKWCSPLMVSRGMAVYGLFPSNTPLGLSLIKLLYDLPAMAVLESTPAQWQFVRSNLLELATAV